mgnify:CR=1 FL=1
MAEVAILGAGHGGCAAAADLTSRGHHLRLHARSEERLKPLLERGGIEARGIVEGFVSLDSLTTDIKEAISGTDVVMLVVPEELSSISDDEKYGNFEIDVPEITQEVYDNSSINAYIRRTYDDGRPERWSQLPQTFLSLDDSSASYLSFGVGFIRISLQSEGSIQELFEMMKGNDLKLVIN